MITLILLQRAFCATAPIAIAMPNVMDNRFKPTRQRPGHPLQRFLGALTGTLNQLQQRLAGRLFIFSGH
jgi:hypothetical protein